MNIIKTTENLNEIIPNTLLQGDCLNVMNYIKDKSIDMILCDPPYGTTDCEWDSVIPFNKHIIINDKIIYFDDYILKEIKTGKPYNDIITKFNLNCKDGMWQHLNRIIKPNGAIVLFGKEPFSSSVIISNLKKYKHKLVWNKKQSGSFANAKFMPLQIEEDILIFTKNGEKVNYYPQMRKGKMRKKGGSKKQIETMGGFIKTNYFKYSDEYYPVNILEDYPNCSNKSNNLHPTQKPVALLEYLIKTYSNENETVLDFTMGSGSTGVACINTNRNFIGIEKDTNYFDIATNRINSIIK